MALPLEDAIAKVKHYFAHEWKGEEMTYSEIREIIGACPITDEIAVIAVMERLGATADFTYEKQSYCPGSHDCESDGHCDRCGERYPLSEVWVSRHISPSPESGIKPKVFGDSEAPKYLEAIRSVVPDMGALTAYAIAEAVIKASRS